MLGLSLLGIVLCYVDRILISIAAINMKADFNWTDTEKGIVLASFFWGYLITQAFGGLLARRFSGRMVFALAVLSWSFFTILTPTAAYTNSLFILVICRFLVGVGEGAAFPAVYTMIYRRMEVSKQSFAVGSLMSGSAIGTIIALLSVPTLIIYFGWAKVFYLFGSLGLVWAVFWFALVPKTIPEDDSLDPRELSPTPWKLFLTNKSALSVFFITTTWSICSFTTVTWLPSYFVDTFDVSSQEAGLYSLVPFLSLLISPLWAGRYSAQLEERGMDKLAIRKLLVYCGIFSGCFFLCTVAFVQSVFLAALLLFAAFLGFGVAQPGFAVMSKDLFPNSGEVMFGMTIASGSIFSSIAIALVGKALDMTGSYTVMFLGIAFLNIIAVLYFHVFASVDPLESRYES
ncbi:MFS transporter [Temperatibacter marinus]|uniref:MFS transporter n=1 Tax=Temperatibacter marinus TaxID=1456591 RepID=A0AA52H8H8_9PROT|nr:MFS transporter [Temperatibacter marinus]